MKVSANMPLLLVLILATILRFGLLSKYPVSLNVDEVAIGYDAFSILKSGRDIHKKMMPFVFESLGDYKPGLYVYLTVPSIAVFGLNEFSVRFPAALAGLLTVLVLYLTVGEFTKNKRLALISAFVLSLSPWHLKLSRGAFEATLALFLLMFGFYLTLLAVRKGKKMNWGIVFFALSMHAYHSEKVIAPILLLLVVFVFRKELVDKKILKWWAVTFVIALIPFLLTLGHNNQSRLAAKVVTNDPEMTMFLSRSTGSILAGKAIASANTIFKRYIEILDFGYTLNKGLDLTSSTSFDLGWIYWLEFPFLVAGVYLLIRKNNIFTKREYLYCFIFLILLTPVPSSITMDDYHIFRLLPLTIPYSILIAVGVNYFLEIGERMGHGKKFFTVVLLMYLINLSYFFDYYLIQFPIDRSDWLFDPSKEVALTVLDNMNKYEKIIVDPVFGKKGPYLVGVPDLYILFYGKITPQQYWKESNDDGFMNIAIRKVDWKVESKYINRLVIGSVWSLSENEFKSQAIKSINFVNGDPAYFVMETPNK